LAENYVQDLFDKVNPNPQAQEVKSPISPPYM